MKHKIHPDLINLATPIDGVRINPANTNTHPERQLVALEAMLTEFGQRAPLIVRRSTGVLEAGEGRLLAMRRLGWTHAAVLVCDDDAVTAVRFGIGDNQVGRLSEDDEERLALQIKALVDDGGDVAALGFDADEVLDLIASLDDPDAVEEAADEDLEVDGAPPFLITGDLVIIGEHRLVIGDSRDPSTISLLMGDELADLIVTDPPYGVAYEGGMKPRDAIENDDLGVDGTRELVASAAKLWPAKPGAPFYVFGPAGDLVFTFGAGLGDAGRRVRQILIWAKNVFSLGHADYRTQHETIFYGWIDGAARYWCGSRSESTVLEYARPQKSDAHPTTKPVALVAALISNSSRPGDIVFDGFGGSGSTMRAAHQLGRRARLVELTTGYGDAICRSMVALGERVEVVRNGARVPWIDNRGHR